MAYEKKKRNKKKKRGGGSKRKMTTEQSEAFKSVTDWLFVGSSSPSFSFSSSLDGFSVTINSGSLRCEEKLEEKKEKEAAVATDPSRSKGSKGNCDPENEEFSTYTFRTIQATLSPSASKIEMKRVLVDVEKVKKKRGGEDLFPVKYAGLWWRFWWLSIFFFIMVAELSATPVPILTINSPDGDIVDCIRRETQPTLSHPYFRNHKFQETPTDLPNVAKMEDQFSWQIWHRNGTRCPDETIPLRRIHKMAGSGAEVEATKGHEYAIASLNQTSAPPQIYGTRATMSVMHPSIERPQEFSLGQIWLVSGSYKENNLNTIEAGWQTDTYTYTRCYNLRCPGFVQTSSSVLLEGAISTTSTFGGPQTELIINIWKDVKFDIWWLGVGLNNGTVLVPVGYWPTKIFTRLLDHAENVQWGGEIVNINIFGQHTTTQMGSGYLPNNPKAAYMRDLEIAGTKGNLQPVHDLLVGETDPNYYKVKMLSNTSFSYGGPLHASAVYYRPTSIFLCFSFSLFLLF